MFINIEFIANGNRKYHDSYLNKAYLTHAFFFSIRNIQLGLGGDSDKREMLLVVFSTMRLPWWLSGKEFACNAGVGWISGSGKSPEGGHDNPF